MLSTTSQKLAVAKTQPVVLATLMVRFFISPAIRDTTIRFPGQLAEPGAKRAISTLSPGGIPQWQEHSNVVQDYRVSVLAC